MTEHPQALITGGKGFFGEHLTRRLTDLGYVCRTFDLADGQDITDRRRVLDSVRRGDTVFHLAGILGTHELNDKAYLATAVNIGGALNVFDSARQHNARVVAAAKPNPWLNAYSITKRAAEDFARMYHETFGCDFRVGRFFSLYGPGQKTRDHGVQKAVPTFIMQALANEAVPIFGDGKQTADFIYTDDAAEAFVRLGKRDNLGGKAIDIGTGQETEINALADLIIRLAGSKSKVEHVPMRSGEPPGARVFADTSQMASLLDFIPGVSLEDGMSETVNWYRRNIFERGPSYSIPL